MCSSFFFTGTAVAFEKKEDLFPIYESIKPNVTFWKKIYSEYTTSQIIFHDRRNLSIIYGVVHLKDINSPGARKYNKEITNDKKKYYMKLLKRLSSGHEPSTSEEKQILALFADHNLKDLLKDSHNNIRVQLGQKDRFTAGLIRSGAYFDEIQEILRGYGIPDDLAYLPHVESSFDYQAYSKFGAAGIWQFTHGTGRRFLKIDYTVDERRDPILATHAAARFLKENYDMLKSWPVAITAYNHGAQGMLKALNLHKNYESIYNKYNGRSFGFASRNFYSEFLAAREVAGNYRGYFGELKLDNPVKRIMIETPGYVAIEDLVKYLNLPVSKIKKLNPALREPVYSNQKYVPKGSRIYLPEESLSYIGSGSPKIPSGLLKGNQKPSLFYRVQRGDSANKIARAHNVRLKDLILANQLGPQATIYEGQNLRIPGTGEKIIIASSQDITDLKPGYPEPSQNTLKPSAPEQTETAPLKPGEETKPLSVSLHETDDVDKVKVSSEEPFVSQEEELKINPLVVTGDLSIGKVTTVNGKVTGIIRVEPEETLGHYADWLKIETQKIRKLNGFSYARSISIGQMIKIPLDNTSREVFEEKRYEYHKEIEEDFFATYRVERTEKYTIRKGDNIWLLCSEKFEIPFWLLKKYNPEINFGRLSVSNKLTIPIVYKIGE